MAGECVADARGQVLRCLVCGEEVPMPMGMVRWFAGVCRAFELAHRGCDGRKGKTGFAKCAGGEGKGAEL